MHFNDEDLGRFEIVKIKNGLLARKDDEVVLTMRHSRSTRKEHLTTFFAGEKKVLVMTEKYSFLRRKEIFEFEDSSLGLSIIPMYSHYHLRIKNDEFRTEHRSVFNPTKNILFNNRLYGQVYIKTFFHRAGDVKYEITLREDGNEIYALIVFMLETLGNDSPDLS